jgi:hypothetical protein
VACVGGDGDTRLTLLGRVLGAQRAVRPFEAGEVRRQGIGVRPVPGVVR